MASFLGRLRSNVQLFKRKRPCSLYGDSDDESTSRHAKRRAGSPIIITDSDDDDDDVKEVKPRGYGGRGSIFDPIVLPEWHSPSIISDESKGELVEISDDEDEDWDYEDQDDEDGNDEESPLFKAPAPLSPSPLPNALPSRSQNLWAGAPGVGDYAKEESPIERSKFPAFLDLINDSDADNGDDENGSLHEGTDDEDEDHVFSFTGTSSSQLSQSTLALSQETDVTSISSASSQSQEATRPKHSIWATKTKDIEAFFAGTSSKPGADRYSVQYDNQVTLDLVTRKKLFWYRYWKICLPQIRRTFNRYLEHANASDDEQCYLYKGPRLASAGRVLSLTAQFRHKGHMERLTINVGLVAMLLDDRITDAHRKGIVEEGFHASHLCGNWTCINSRHIVPELGAVNINRNRCFPKMEEACWHTPPCMKHLKQDGHNLRSIPAAKLLQPPRPSIYHNSYGFHDLFKY
ncbi:hypothetical protein BU24DRAFT_457843 [Aaosphaeria arxii CBS 175.79]|uniref:Zinc-binding loop region of homing endonuclease domain-containing protein n=1 Tax=Aaosphaeria arxii CBS 175.79 TaxID=1450172 RepID=A0A6A5YBD6_9PLEO|nr:uncharacterized protein BU24DRAFT_457843 [Aaosphaeria arxii CBS 175.79]KAF2021924.1 hypothetical protein BU24DRAFT_457843 [Aaosphaeria arxii CBS 175.79]